jgi:flagellar basal body-associated protein FliL
MASCLSISVYLDNEKSAFYKRISMNVSSGAGKGAPVFLTVLCRGLAVVAAALALVILAGTVWTLARQGRAPAPAPVEEGETGPAFINLGRLRLASSGSPPATVILSIAFPYPADDRAFSEELTARMADFRAVVADYFAASTAQELQDRDEALMKAELLDRCNALLRLGRIEALYFNDFLVLE